MENKCGGFLKPGWSGWDRYWTWIGCFWRFRKYIHCMGCCDFGPLYSRSSDGITRYLGGVFCVGRPRLGDLLPLISAQRICHGGVHLAQHFRKRKKSAAMEWWLALFKLLLERFIHSEKPIFSKLDLRFHLPGPHFTQIFRYPSNKAKRSSTWRPPCLLGSCHD